MDGVNDDPGSAYQIYSGNTGELMACESSGSYQIKCTVVHRVTAVFVGKCEDTMDLSLFCIISCWKKVCEPFGFTWREFLQAAKRVCTNGIQCYSIIHLHVFIGLTM